MRPLYIFDLDGTIALIDHRRHLVEGETKEWRAFFAACVDDEPNHPVIDTLMHLLDSGADVWIWSGRSSEVMNQTKDWLADHLGSFGHGVPLMMRLEGDFTPDEVLKADWLDGLDSYDRRRLVAVFDDRDKVVSMWRSKGIPCFQVAPGGF